MTKNYKFTRAWFNHNYARIEKLCGGNPALAEWVSEDLRTKKLPERTADKVWQEGPYMRFGAILSLLEAYEQHGPCYSLAFRSFLIRQGRTKRYWANIARRQGEAA